MSASVQVVVSPSEGTVASLLHVLASKSKHHQTASVAAYDVETRALIEVLQRVVEVKPNVQRLKANGHNSTQLHVNQKALAGRGSNWMQTAPGRAWFTDFRWYDPTGAYYGKSRRLPDIEKAK